MDCIPFLIDEIESQRAADCICCYVSNHFEPSCLRTPLLGVIDMLRYLKVSVYNVVGWGLELSKYYHWIDGRSALWG